MSRVMTSPSSKLSSVGLLPAWWGKMVLTRDFLLRLRPDDCDTEWDRGNSLTLPWSGERIGIAEVKMTHTHTHFKPPIHPPPRPLPECRSEEEEVSGGLGSGLNMVARGLICAFRGGAGGGTRGSWFF